MTIGPLLVKLWSLLVMERRKRKEKYKLSLLRIEPGPPGLQADDLSTTLPRR